MRDMDPRIPSSSELRFIETQEACSGQSDLHLEHVALADVAEAFGTPVYVYSTAAIKRAFQALDMLAAPQGVSICFAVKANSNLSVLRILAQLGCGMDIVSGGELLRAERAGVSGGRIVFSGVGKTASEIEQALARDIHQFNVESAEELQLIDAIAVRSRKKAPVAIRVNPDVDAATHDKISTGRKGDKFGVDLAKVPDLYEQAAQLPSIELVGLAVHLGSQITNLQPFQQGYARLAELTKTLRAKGHQVSRLDLGGGIGIGYDQSTSEPDLNRYFAIVSETVGSLGAELTIEPGRYLVGHAGVLLTEVLCIKESEGLPMAVMDAGMNDLARPALYGAFHHAIEVSQCGRPRHKTKLVGPVCESSDDFGWHDLPALRRGDRLAFASVGAYGAVMSSTYNSRALVPEVLVDRDRFKLVRRRMTVEDLIGLETDPAWSGPAAEKIRPNELALLK